VVIGGFHVSGCLAMLPALPAELQQALDLGASLSPARRKAAWSGCCRTSTRGRMKPIYDHLAELPSLAGAALPLLPRHVVHRVAARYASFDAGRGCPFQCSFCTIINVQGRQSRFRTPDDVEAIVRANVAHGVTRFFVTDDDFARNRNWEPILDRLIALRGEGMSIKLILQRRYAVPSHPALHREGGAGGLQQRLHRPREHQPGLAEGAKKRQNKISEYRAIAPGLENGSRWLTWAGYIVGFPPTRPRDRRPRYRDHQARAAGRPGRILRSDAAAGVGRPQDPPTSPGWRWTPT